MAGPMEGGPPFPTAATEEAARLEAEQREAELQAQQQALQAQQQVQQHAQQPQQGADLQAAQLDNEMEHDQQVQPHQASSPAELQRLMHLINENDPRLGAAERA